MKLTAAAAYPPFLATAPPVPCVAEPDLFVATRNERELARVRREELAVAVCQRCPVRAACLAWAVATGQQGVWGATTDFQRTGVAA